MNIGKSLKNKIILDYNDFNLGLSQICPNLKITPEMIYKMDLDELIDLVEENMQEKYKGAIISPSGSLMVDDRTSDLLKDLCGPYEIPQNSQTYPNETNQERLESLFGYVGLW